MTKKISIWLRKKQLHIMVWAIFITYETVVIGLIFNIFGNPITYIAHYTIIIILFYLTTDVVFPKVLEGKTLLFVRIPVFLFFYLSLYIVAHYLADLCLIRLNIITNEKTYDLNYQFILKNLYRGLYFLGFATAYYFLKQYLQDVRTKKQLLEENLNAVIKQQEIEQALTNSQNAFLKAQINPHFLFNTLDFIYHNIQSNPDLSAKSVICLSKTMRYAIDSDLMGPYAPIMQEIAHVESLINLYKLRNSSLDLNITYPQEVITLNLIPLVLLTLVENIFKHGDLTVPNSSAGITISIDDGSLCIQTKNYIKEPIDFNSKSERGIANIKQRLLNAYGDHTSFKHFQLEDQFFVEIKISLLELNRCLNS
ncbi:sensor histidine kinase [Pedobacter rhodius]|uniref:Histidine kinase n=1 Tax=Pedobacter rhodius TaxID=3004098 RepID=A0ABT4KYJ6_9SPHI|nr:histidine kinase [Pedobacter sp. SJ11]MCZ4224003.1 histidine kinase [Pedobacter sp. SJ11]